MIPNFSTIELDISKIRFSEILQQEGFISKTQSLKAKQVELEKNFLESYPDICCDLGYINNLDIEYILGKFKEFGSLCSAIIHLGYANRKVVELLLYSKADINCNFGDLLVENEVVTRVQLEESLAVEAELPFFKLQDFKYDEFVSATLVRIISARYAEIHGLLPLSTINLSLKVAITNPKDQEKCQELQAHLSPFTVDPIMIPSDRYVKLFLDLYGRKPSI